MMHDVPNISDTIGYNLNRGNEIIPLVLKHHITGYSSFFQNYTKLLLEQHYARILQAYVYQDNIWYYPELSDNAAPAIDLEFSSYTMHELLYHTHGKRRDAVFNILIEMEIAYKDNNQWKWSENCYVHISTDRHYTFFSEKYNIVVFDRYLASTEPSDTDSFNNLVYGPVRRLIGLTLAVLPKTITINYNSLSSTGLPSSNSIFVYALRQADSDKIRIRRIKLWWSRTPILHIRNLDKTAHFNNYTSISPSSIRIFMRKMSGQSTESYLAITRALIGSLWKCRRKFDFSVEFTNLPASARRVHVTQYGMIYL